VGRGGEIRRGDPPSCCKGGAAVGKSAVGIRRREVREAASRARGGGEARRSEERGEVEAEAESEGRWSRRGGSRGVGWWGSCGVVYWFGSGDFVQFWFFSYRILFNFGSSL
jgi:hypothetical protein